AGGGCEVEGTAASLEAQVVRTEETFEDLAPPGEALEDLRWREGDVEEEPDLVVPKAFAQHRRDELELVVVDPDHVALLHDRGGGVGEALIDFHVGAPPVPMELRSADGVVVERPDGGVAEPVVVVGDL